MEKWRKLLTSIRNNKKNVPSADLRALMTSLGFNERQRGPGGHNIQFFHPEFRVFASMAAKGDPVKVGYVNDCLDAVDDVLDAMKKKQNEKEGNGHE